MHGKWVRGAIVAAAVMIFFGYVLFRIQTAPPSKKKVQLVMPGSKSAIPIWVDEDDPRIEEAQRQRERWGLTTRPATQPR